MEKSVAEILGMNDPDIQAHLKKNPEQAVELTATVNKLHEERVQRAETTAGFAALGEQTNTYGFKLTKLYVTAVSNKIVLGFVLIIFLILVVTAILRALATSP